MIKNSINRVPLGEPGAGCTTMLEFLLITIINSSSYRISNLIFSGKGKASLGFGNCISTISQFCILNEGLFTVLPSTFSC